MINTILTNVRNGVLTITINRPEAKNAINPAMSEAIAAAIDELDNNDELSVGIITGAGGTFCAGTDLKAYSKGERPSPEVQKRGFAGLVAALPKKPLIGALEGYILAGGLELSLACDLTVCSESSMFGVPEVKLGLVAAQGGVSVLPRIVPRRVALEMALTGSPISAQRAYELSLVNHVVPDGEVMAKARELADTIAANAPLAVAASKSCIYASEDWPTDEIFSNQTPFLKAARESEDAKEGPRAFIEKRAPVWKGK